MLVAGAGTKTIANHLFGLINSPDYGIGVTAGAAVITNESTIHGGKAAILTSSGGRMSLNNKGVVHGDVSCTAANGVDTIVSSGRILGNINLGPGNDSVVNSGEILGNVDLGPGSDTFVFAGGTQIFVKGGADADRFDFKARAPGALIDDFTPGTDKIGLSKAGFNKIGNEGPLKEKYFEVGKTADDKRDHVIWDKKNGGLYYDQDGKGGASQELLAGLDGGLKIKAGDFIVLA